MAVDGTVLTWPVLSTPSGRNAVVVARQGLHGDELELDSTGLEYREMRDALCASSSTGRYGDRR